MNMRVIITLATTVAVSGLVPAINNNVRSLNMPNVFKMSNSALKMGQKATIPNPFKALPWNVKKEMEREARRYKMESASLHRELGISEDATFEEITEVTQNLIAAANQEGDVKKKIKAEIAKDRIMQIRLNERLAGLTKLTDDAQAQSRREEEEEEEEDDLLEDKPKEWRVPRFAEGLIKKPTPEWRNQQIKVFGGMSLLSFVLPPMATVCSMVNGYFAAGMLSRRGMSEDIGGDYSPFERKSKPHQKTAVLLSFAFWVVLRVWVMQMGKIKYIFGPRYVPVVEVTIMNIFLGFFVAYTQTYKGK